MLAYEVALKSTLCSELGRIKRADPTLNHKEAFKQAAANWQQSKSSSIDSLAEAPVVQGCQGVSMADHNDIPPARLANSQGPAKAVGKGSAVADSSDESEVADEEDHGVQAQKQNQFRRLYKPTPYNDFMKRG